MEGALPSRRLVAEPEPAFLRMADECAPHWMCAVDHAPAAARQKSLAGGWPGIGQVLAGEMFGNTNETLREYN